MVSWQRWRFEDPADTNPTTRVYTLPWNPNKMSSPFPERNITFEGTTALDGQPLMWESIAAPASWSFGGVTKDDAHYEALRSWVYDRQGRLYVWDHYGRRLTVSMKKFDPEPKTSIGHRWRHTYTITALVYAITAPTLGLGE